MKRFLFPSIALAMLALAADPADRAMAQQTKPIRIGVNTAIQPQVGRDAIDSVKMAIDEINAQGGVLGRKLEMVVADEGEAATDGPKVGIAAVNKLTSEDHVDVLIGGYDSGVTLGELPHIARAKTIFLGIGSASPAIQQKVKDDYDHYKYIFRVNPINSARQSQALLDFITGKLKGELGLQEDLDHRRERQMGPGHGAGHQEGRAGRRHRGAGCRVLRRADRRFLTALRQGEGQRLAVSDRHHVARRVRRFRQAVVRRQGAGADRRHRRQRAWTPISSTGSAASRSPKYRPISCCARRSRRVTVPWWDKFVSLNKRPPVYTAARRL